ncbi:MAG: DUF4892 domain-containing protein [Marinobacter sp.]|nr:DUF4892 domain-containing protein [Marinobacter sp.]
MSARWRGGKRRLAVLLALLCSPVYTLAAISAFPLATVEENRRIETPGHLVLLSPVREINNQIRSETMARVAVSGQGTLLEIRPDSSRQDARAYYVDALRRLDATTLFECSGRACGRSIVWANQIFSESRLYGRDQDQDYLAAAYVTPDGKTQLVLVYTVTRGNLRQYLWVEQLTLAEGTVLPGFSGRNERVLGPVVVTWTGDVTRRFDWDAETRRQVQDWLQRDGDRLVIHSFTTLRNQESLDESKARARAAGEAFQSVLGSAGVPRERQHLIVIGPTLPMGAADRKGDRIELVAVQDIRQGD